MVYRCRVGRSALSPKQLGIGCGGRMRDEALFSFIHKLPMIRTATALYGYQLLATDGVVGEVADFLFDDESWQVRYLVIEAGGWLSARRLIAPEAVHQAEWDARRLPASLTKEQVRQSPEYDPARPMTRENEVSLRGHYGWKRYWRGDETPIASPDGGRRDRAVVPDRHPEAVTPAVSPGAGADAEMAAAARGAEEAQLDQNEPQLRSTRDVIGYHVQATDGAIGHVEDFLLDDQSWQVRFIVIDTRNWWPGKKVLLSPQSIQNVSWPESHLAVTLTREEIQNAPEYDPDSPPEETGLAYRRRGDDGGAAR
jgi:uncharacterized protein YrrD